MHDRVANKHNFDNVVALKPRLFSRTVNQILQAAYHRGGHFTSTIRVHNAIGYPAHQIFTKSDLRIHRPGRGQHIARDHIA